MTILADNVKPLIKGFFHLLIILCALQLPLTSYAQSPIYAFDSTKQEAQFSHLIKQLRCVVCQNQDLAESNASLAVDLREHVYQWVTQGKTDQEITHYLTARYGDFILLKPPLKPMTWLLWWGPLLFFILGLWIFRQWFRRYTDAS